MSASRPMGTSVMAAARRKADATQLKPSAVMENSRAIIGSATLTDDPMKGVVNELMVVASRTMGSFFLPVMPSREKQESTVAENVFYAVR